MPEFASIESFRRFERNMSTSKRGKIKTPQMRGHLLTLIKVRLRDAPRVAWDHRGSQYVESA